MKSIQNLNPLVSFIKSLSVVLSLLFIIISCSNEDDEVIQDPVLETFKIQADKSTVKPLEFVTLESDEINFSEESYTAKINGFDVDVFTIEDNKLMFSFPDTDIGQANFELKVGDKIGNLSFTVEENAVDNPEAIIERELSTPLNDFNADIVELQGDSSLPLEVKTHLSSAKKMLEDYLAKLNKLSEEEKTQVARFYNVNPFFTDEFLNSEERESAKIYDCFKVNAQKVVLTTVSIVAFIDILPTIVSAGPVGSVTAIVGFVAGVYAAASIISAAHEYLLSECFLPYEHLFRDYEGKPAVPEIGKSFEAKNNLAVSNTIFKRFSVKALERHLISSDASSASPIVSSVTEKLNLVIGKWSTLKEGVNSIVKNLSNWFYDWFGETSTTYEPISYSFRPIPESSAAIESFASSEFISITGFPSDVQVEFSIDSGTSINLKLTTDNSTLPRTVSGILRFDDGNFVTQSSISFTIEKIVDIVGVWTLAEFNGTATNTYISIIDCPEEPSEESVYGGYRLFGTATFTESTFTADVGRNQVYNNCITNSCANASFCYNDPDFIPHSGTYQRVGNDQFIITSDSQSSINVIDENTMIITQGGGTKRYVR